MYCSGYWYSGNFYLSFSLFSSPVQRYDNGSLLRPEELAQQ
jgi:hypothetical protein